MKLLNYSAEYENILYNWLPHDLKAERVVFFPDACPGKSPLPTGTAVLTKQQDWRKFAVSDCGCGMLLLKTDVKVEDFNKSDWDRLYLDLKKNKGKKGDLGSGNHFLDALQAYDDNDLYLLIHTGSREESKSVETLVDRPEVFDKKFLEVCLWAEENRKEVSRMAEKYFGLSEIIMDRNHNSYEILEDGSVIIRKGAVRLLPGEITVIPSSMDGDAVLVRAEEKISEVLNSMSHGTGRIMSRGNAKVYAEHYDYSSLRERLYIPSMISDSSIKTEAPFCYRDLDRCLELIEGLVEEVKRFAPLAYMGQI